MALPSTAALSAYRTADGAVQLTVSSPTNIAVIKYWGKADARLNTPINSSVSVTINKRDLRTTTTVTASKSFERDRLWLNGVEEDAASNKRVQAVLAAVRSRAGDAVDASGAVLVAKAEWPQYRVHVVSANNFPTAAGLASSAAGYAALAYALATLHGFTGSAAELSTIARQGSGSAIRSLAGGFVAWDMGRRADGSDSVARQVAPADHWPELCVLILVVSDAKKTVSSTAGMGTSVKTSPLLAHRAAAVVPDRLRAMEAAYLARDFGAFATLAMQDSNQFHATCLDTHPPIFYLNDVSRAIIQMVHAFNDAAGEVRLGYTFDAGPNAVLLLRREHAADVLAAVLKYFLPSAAAADGYAATPRSPPPPPPRRPTRRRRRLPAAAAAGRRQEGVLHRRRPRRPRAAAGVLAETPACRSRRRTEVVAARLGRAVPLDAREGRARRHRWRAAQRAPREGLNALLRASPRANRRRLRRRRQRARGRRHDLRVRAALCRSSATGHSPPPHMQSTSWHSRPSAPPSGSARSLLRRARAPHARRDAVRMADPEELEMELLEVMESMEDRMKKSVASVTEQLATLRVGRATPDMLARVEVDYYGAMTPLNQLASVSAPTPQQLVVDVYDKDGLGDVERAIIESDVGMTPQNDGKLIRLNVPMLTEERRKELAKTASALGEEGKVAIRNVRRDAIDKIKKLEKRGVSEDTSADNQDEVQKALKKAEGEVEAAVAAREKEITTI